MPTDIKEISAAMRQAAQDVTNPLPKWEPYHHSTNGRTHDLRLMTRPSHPPMKRYRKRADGTIHVTDHTGSSNDHLPINTEHVDIQLLASEIQARIIHRTAELTGDPTGVLTTVYSHQQQQKTLLRQLHSHIASAMEAATSSVPRPDTALDYLNWPRQLPPTLKQAQADATAVVFSQMIDSKVIDLIKEFHDHHYSQAGPIPDLYNWFALNARTLQDLQKATPGLPVYYCHLLYQTQPKPRKLHPGQIVSAVKEDTQLDGTLWRSFCRLGPHMFINRLFNRPMSAQPESLEDTRTICAALAQANRPRARPQAVRLLHGIAANLPFYRTTEPVNLQPWQAAVNLINRYLEPQDQDPHLPEDLADTQDSLRFQDLRNIEDALRYHVNQDLPWSPATWPELIARSNRWHAQLTDSRSRLTHGQPWKSALPKTETEGLTITPVTSPQDIEKFALTMHNCLTTYIPRCQQNLSRIFTIHDEGRLIAAAEIVNDHGRWTTGQTEAPHRRPLPAKARKAASQIPALYSQAEKEADTKRAANSKP